MLKQQSVIDSGSKCPIITYEIANKLGFERDKNLPNITDKAVSDIVKQVAGKKIWISLHRLLEIVKPEIRQELINAIVKPDISRRNRTPCKAKRKKRFLNDTASESSSSPSSGSDSESSSYKVKAKKLD